MFQTLIFSGTLLLSALLLFWVQPFIAKMVLPILGGAVTVWITCMMFFQAMLLASYIYVHLSYKYLQPRSQLVLHFLILLVSVYFLPVHIGPRFYTQTTDHYCLWLVMLLFFTLGLPFFALSANAPLLQGWFSRTGHRYAHDPYFLYATSNIGSLLALIAFPFLLEPMWDLNQQGRIWYYAFCLLIFLVLVCGLHTLRQPVSRNITLSGTKDNEAIQAPDWSVRLKWILYSFIPSSLLLGVTSFTTLDVPSLPLYWILPLVLYLLSFVIAFSRKPIFSHKKALEWYPLALQAAVIFAIPGLFSNPLLLGTIVLLPAFFVIVLAYHGTIVQSRPASRYLTSFYIWIALGGVLGGVFNALLAPVMFDSIMEFPLILFVACFVRPVSGRHGHLKWLDLIIATLSVFLLYVVVRWVYSVEFPEIVLNKLLSSFYSLMDIIVVVFLLSQFVIFVFRQSYLLHGILVAVFLIAGSYYMIDDSNLIYSKRSFFGTYNIYENDNADYHLLYHGTVIHGIQKINGPGELEPISYYSKDGPLGQVFRHLGERSEPLTVAVVGLGVGTTACYARQGDTFTFYEIDPLVKDLASDNKYFTYITKGLDHDIIIGDARLKLSEARIHEYDLIVLDAFSSDSIPVHLMTKEALQLYTTKLRKKGIIAFHITNLNLDLAPVIATLARDLNLTALINSHSPTIAQRENYILDSEWIVLAHDSQALRGLSTKEWQELEPERDILWTDQFSNILSVIKP